MSKPALVGYKVFEGEEKGGVFWVKGQDGVVECEGKDMKPGIDYFEGKVKKDGDKKVYFYEKRIRVM